MKENRILNVLGQVSENYIEEAAPDGPFEKEGKKGRARLGIILAAAAILILGTTAALAAGSGIDIIERIMGAYPVKDPDYIQEMVENGQWVYMNDDNIAVIVPEGPVKVLLSADGGETWRESVVAGSEEWEWLPDHGTAVYWGGYIGFTGEKVGYLVLTSGVAMGQESLRVFLTSDGGETWYETGAPNAGRVPFITGAGFASENVGFISCSGAYFQDPALGIWRTTDGGRTWSELWIELPGDLIKHYADPLSPTFEGLNGIYPILVDPSTENKMIYMYTHDGGMTWSFDQND